MSAIHDDPRPANESGLTAIMLREAAEELSRAQAAQRDECPRMTMVYEAMQALDRLASRDATSFRYLMAMSCVDALVGQSAIEHSIHPCVLLDNPPRVAEIDNVRTAIQQQTPPLCMTSEPLAERRVSSSWWCGPP